VDEELKDDVKAPVGENGGSLSNTAEAVPNWSPSSNEAAAPAKEETDMALGNAVFTMGQVGGDARNDDVDDTSVGHLNEMIHKGDVADALAVLRNKTHLAFMADTNGMTPLHWAADSGRSEVMKALIAMLGDDAAAAQMRVNVQDHEGNTPLHFAAMTENDDVARILIAAGADPKVENEYGMAAIAFTSGDKWAAFLSGSRQCQWVANDPLQGG